MQEIISEIPVKAIEKNKVKALGLLQGGDKIAVKAVWFGDSGASQVEAHDSEVLQFGDIIADFNRQCVAVKNGFDNIPVANLDFGGVAWLMSIAYGCDIVRLDGRISARPLYWSIEEASHMEKREKIYNYGLYPLISERIDRFQKQYPFLPVTIADNQSPIDVITCILHSEEAIVAMYDQPEAVHKMLGIVTASIIEINKYFQSSIRNFGGFRAGDFQPLGMHAADDNAAFLSPSIYHEFAVPYAGQLSDEFGGINLHCCLRYVQNLENMAGIRGFLGFDANPDFNPADKIIHAMEGKRAVWEVFNFPWSKRTDRGFSDEEMFIRCIDASEGKCGMSITVNAEDMDSTLHLADRVRSYIAKRDRLL